MAVELKFSKIDNAHWGFRLTGGNDCNMPLTVVKVSEGSIAEQVGLRENDIIIRINDIDTGDLSHDEAHEVILYSGNCFVATVIRNETHQFQQSSTDIEYETLPLSDPTSFTNDINQVPIPDTKPPVYRPFSNKTFPDIPPLESPLIFSGSYKDDFQTINQREWKEFSSKHTKTSVTESTMNSCVKQTEFNAALNHIDLKEIENSAKESIIDENISTTVQLVENSKDVVNVEKKVISDSESNVETKICNKVAESNVEAKICNKVAESNVETKVCESQTICDSKSKEQTLSQETVAIKECVKFDANESKNVKETITKNEMYDKSKEISLEVAKMEAIKAANTLSHQAKINGVNTFEGTKMGTADAFRTLSENMQHKCSAVPCEAVKLETQSQTDLLLKTFFVHLTDVMVALTQMISQDHTIKCCSNSCGPYCVCMKKCNKSVEENVCIKESNEKTFDSKSEKQVKEEKYLSTVMETKDEVRSESRNSHTEEVLKEVIDNIQSATGVDVTVNGKDPLEWLADLDETKTTTKKLVINEAVQHEVAAESKVVSEVSEVNEVVENVKLVSEKVQEHTLSSVVAETVQEVATEKIEDVKKSKEIRSGWDVKVASKDPQTPNTDEYVFRLDIKLKGNLPDAPSNIPEGDEPSIHEDLSIVKRPTFTIGDVEIETKTNKTIDPDKKILKIRQIEEISSPETETPVSNKMYEAIVTGVKTTCFQEKLDVKESSEYKSVEESLTEKAETITNISNINLKLTDSNITNVSSEIVDSTHSIDTSKITSDLTDTVISSIPASANDIPASANHKSASAYNSVANGQEEMHETVLTSTEKNIESSQSLMQTNSESSTLVEEVALEVKTMGESSKNFASISSDNKIMTINDNFICQGNGKPGLSDKEVTKIVSGDAIETKEQHIIGLTKVLASHMNRPDDEINSCEPKPLIPQCLFLKDSEVFKALNEENLKIKAERLQESRKKFTSFLIKPNRPIPFCKRESERLEFQEPPYKVNIKKQVKQEKTEEITNILTEGLFLVPEVPILIPEPQPQYFEAPEYLPDSSFPDLEDTGIKLPEKVIQKTETPVPADNSVEEEVKEVTEENTTECEAEKTEESEVAEVIKAVDATCEEGITDENMTVEQQLANVQKQLVALSMLPLTIQQTLDQVTKKITQIVTKKTGDVDEECVVKNEETEEIVHEESSNEKIESEEMETTEEKENENKDEKEEKEIVEENQVDAENQNVEESKTETCENIQQETCEMKVEAKTEIKEEKNIHELRKDLICELNEEHVMRQVKQRPGGRVGRPKPAFGPLTPQERPIVLPGGRKWRGPKDAFTDSFIAETLSGQAEVIMGKALGSHVEYIYPPYNERVNFMKYAKPPKTLDHLKGSSVYKLIHDEEEPLHGVQARAGVVLAESDYREKCRSVTPTSFNKQDPSMETEVS